MLACPQLWAATATLGKHTLYTAAKIEQGRTCCSGHHPHQPVEFSRCLNHSYLMVNEPEWCILCVYNGMGKTGAGLGSLDMGNLFLISWGLLHSLPSALAATGKGPSVLVAASAETMWQQEGKEETIQDFEGLWDSLSKGRTGRSFHSKTSISKGLGEEPWLEMQTVAWLWSHCACPEHYKYFQLLWL